MKRLWNMLTGRGRSASCPRSLSLATGARTTSTRKVRLQLEALEGRFLPSVSFASPVNYATGDDVFSIATGDLTGNGIQDLVVASRLLGPYVVMGNGNGTFQAPVSLQSPTFNEYSVALGDLSGIPDIVMCGVGGNDDLAVYMNNGNGTFQTPAQYSIGGHTTLSCVALADLTGNGIRDIIVTDSNASTVDVLMGNGDGTFQTPVTYPAGGAVGGGYGSHGMVVADLTGNGLSDIVDVSSNGVSVLMNQGNGTFGPATTFAAGSGLNSVAVADLNGDGIPDIVASNPGSNAVTVLLGTGGGSFGAPQSYSTGAGTDPIDVAVANINGRADIVTADSATNAVSVLPNNGDGTFAAPLTFATGPKPEPIAVADLNNDGQPDIITGSDNYISLVQHNVVSVLLNTSGPSFAVSGFPSSVTAGTTATITVTALNTDGTVNTGYTGTVHFTSSDPKAVLPADSTLTNGTGTFNVTLETAGTQSITAKDTSNGNMTGSESGITVNPAAASQFIITGPASVSSGTAFNITVTVEDAYGNVVPGYTGTVHFSDSVGGATLPANYTFTSADAGVHTFKSLKLKTKGTNVLTVIDTANSSITGSLTVKVT